MSLTGGAWTVVRRLLGAQTGVAPSPPRRPSTSPPLTDLPDWAEVGKRRRAHIERVAALVEEWADEMEISERERRRWLNAVWLHDALKDADLPRDTTHGAAAAERAELEGESDRGVLDAVRYHSFGYAGWDAVGRMLYLADFLEPGRRGRRKTRERLAERVPHDRDDVLREVVVLQIRARLRAGRPIHHLTFEFWNALAED